MFYEEQLISGIRRFLAPDIMTVLKNADKIELMYPQKYVKVPLQAAVGVAWDKGLCAFAVDATIKDKAKDSWISGRSYFSTRDIASQRDKAAIIEYLFDEAKKQILNALAEDKLKQIFGKEYGI